MTVFKIAGLRFMIADDHELWRAKTLYTKEPGTIRWIKSLRPGDVVYDVGANIGLYTVLIAQQVGATGHVYALEPHPANVASLLRNIEANQLTNVTVLPVAAGNLDTWAPITFSSLRAGTSNHQVDDVLPPTMITRTVRLDTVAWIGRDGGFVSVMKTPDAVKIDVDGIETKILEGLGILQPRTIQVEVQAGTDLRPRLTVMGYTNFEVHDTANGAVRRAHGGLPAFNLVGTR